MGDAVLAQKLLGVAEKRLDAMLLNLANARRDWLDSPAFGKALMAARTALTEEVQLHHGASRVKISDAKPAEYKVAGKVQPKESWASDILASDLLFLAVLRDLFISCRNLGLDREAAWVADRIRYWRDLLADHFQAQLVEMTQLRDRYFAGCAKVEAGEVPADKMDAAMGLIGALLSKLMAIYDEIDSLYPTLIPSDFWPEDRVPEQKEKVAA